VSYGDLYLDIILELFLCFCPKNISYHSFYVYAGLRLIIRKVQRKLQKLHPKEKDSMKKE